MFLAQFMGPTGTLKPRHAIGINERDYKRLQEAHRSAIRLGVLPGQGNPYWKYHLERKGLTTHFSETKAVQVCGGAWPGWSVLCLYPTPHPLSNEGLVQRPAPFGL